MGKSSWMIKWKQGQLPNALSANAYTYTNTNTNTNTEWGERVRWLSESRSSCQMFSVQMQTPLNLANIPLTVVIIWIYPIHIWYYWKVVILWIYPKVVIIWIYPIHTQSDWKVENTCRSILGSKAQSAVCAKKGQTSFPQMQIQIQIQIHHVMTMWAAQTLTLLSAAGGTEMHPVKSPVRV